MKSATLEVQPFLFDVYCFPVPPRKKRQKPDIADNDDMYYGYLILKILLTHDFPDEVIDDINCEAHSKEFDKAHYRAMWLLTTSHTSLASGSCYTITGLDGYNNHICGHAKRTSNKEHLPKRYGIRY